MGLLCQKVVCEPIYLQLIVEFGLKELEYTVALSVCDGNVLELQAPHDVTLINVCSNLVGRGTICTQTVD